MLLLERHFFEILSTTYANIKFENVGGLKVTRKKQAYSTTRNDKTPV